MARRQRRRFTYRASIDQSLVEKRRARVADGAKGMWHSEDPLSQLDTNEGRAPRFIGSPDTIFDRIASYQALGIEMLHLDLSDALFCSEVLPHLTNQ